MKRVIIFITIAILAISCSADRNHEHHAEENSHLLHENHISMETDEPSGFSIYHAGSTWLNENEEEIALSDLSGKIQVVTMVYTYCEFACPRIVADMKRIEASLSEAELENTNFLIVSIDPERDTPERLASFAEKNNLSPENWTLLNGDDGDILELAALLGVRYKRISEDDFSHSNIITVLNREGEVAHRQLRIGDQPTNTIQTIKELAD